MSERMKIVDVIGEKIYKDGERIITQVSWGLDSQKEQCITEYSSAHLQCQHLRPGQEVHKFRPAWATLYYSDSNRGDGLPLIPALRKDRQAGLFEFEASLVYLMSSTVGSCVAPPTKTSKVPFVCFLLPLFP